MIAQEKVPIADAHEPPFDTIAEETEFESLAAYAQLLAKFMADPDVVAWEPTWFKRWNEVTEPGGNNEIWRLVD